MNPHRLTTHSTRAAIEGLSSFFYPLNIGWIRAAALIRALDCHLIRQASIDYERTKREKS